MENIFKDGEAASRITAALINAGYIKKGPVSGGVPNAAQKEAVEEAGKLFAMVYERLLTLPLR